jgi:hypothetical protein
MRANQNFLVLGLITVVVILGAVVISVRTGKSREEAVRNSVKVGLQQVYDRLTSSNKTEAFYPDQVRLILQNKSTVLLPSFIESKDVLIANSPVTATSGDLLCAVKMRDNSYLGVTGRREITRLSQDRVALWPHQRLQGEHQP